MTNLQKKSLGITPLTNATVESFYDGTRSGTPEQCLKALCESHERLRAELDGAEEMLRQYDALKLKLEVANAKIAAFATVARDGWVEAWVDGNGFMALPYNDACASALQSLTESRLLKEIKSMETQN